MPVWMMIAWACLAGSLLAAQGPINAQLGRVLGNSLVAALTSFAVGSIALLLAVLATGGLRRALPQAGSVPWHAWCGGLLGALYVFTAVILAPRLGMSLLTGCVLIGTMLASLLLDQMGAFGLPVQPITIVRLVGAACTCLGVAIMLWR
jgi:transporter family-2 protein